MADKYVKGVQTHILSTDKDTGQPTAHIERDPDGQLWHVRQGEDPARVREDEVEGLVADAGKGSGSDRSEERSDRGNGR